MIPFKVVTLHGVTYEDDIEKVTIPTAAGEITVHPNHAALVSVLQPGEVVIHKEGHTVPLVVSAGLVEIRPTGEVYIMADTAERAEDIDLDRAEQKAKARAEELMKQQHSLQDVDFARIQALIEKDLARIDVGNRYRKLRV